MPLPIRTLATGLVGLCVVWLSACSRAPETEPSIPTVAADEFSVMTYNLHRYALADRDGDGQANDPKPADERAAVIHIITQARPDVLAVQEIGNPLVFHEFRAALQTAGLDFPHTVYLQRGSSENNLAVFSRFPIVSHRLHTNDVYSIGVARVPVSRGFLEADIQVRPDYQFRLLVAHLKSKVFHPLGQTEMRRNEARLLNNHVRRALRENPDLNLLVVGDMNDTFSSAALREVIGKPPVLTDLRPADEIGDVWTWFGRLADSYERIDYLLASSGMLAEVVQEKTRAVREENLYRASDHRPVLGVFKNHEQPAVAPTNKPRARRTVRTGQETPGGTTNSSAAK